MERLMVPASAWEPKLAAVLCAQRCGARTLRAHAGAWARSAGGAAWGLIASKLASTWASAWPVGASLLAIRV